MSDNLSKTTDTQEAIKASVQSLDQAVDRAKSRFTLAKPFWLWVAICLLVAVSAIALIGILKTTDSVRQEAEKRFFEQYNQQQLLLAEQAAHSVEATFATFRRNLSLVASLFSTHGATKARAEEVRISLDRMYQSLSDTDIIELVVFDKEGTVIAISPHDEYTLGRNYAWRGYYKWARDEGVPGATYLSPFLQLEGGQNRGDKALIVAQGIYNEQWQFDGVAMLTVNFDKLARKQILPVRIGKHGYAWLADIDEQKILIDPNGVVDNKGFDESFLPRWPKLHALLLSSKDGQPGTGSYEFFDPANPADPKQHVTKLVGYYPVKIEDRLWTLGVATPAREVDKLLSSFLQSQERFSGTLVVVIFSGTFILLTVLLSWNHLLSEQVAKRTRDLAEARAHLESTFNELLASKKLAAVGHLALGLAHEIRNPLSAIRMNIQMIRKKHPTQGGSQENFTIVEEEILRLNRLVNDVMDFARARPMRLQEVKPSDIIRRVMRLMSQSFEEEQVHTELQLNEELTLVCDPEQIEQVLLNLVSNAIEAMQESEERKMLTIVLRRQHPYVLMQIHDTGPGISTKDQEKIFDPFYTTKTAGGGLGLPTLQGIVLRHKGSVHIEDSTEGNTCFTVLLPIKGPNNPEENAA